MRIGISVYGFGDSTGYGYPRVLETAPDQCKAAIAISTIQCRFFQGRHLIALYNYI